MKIGKQAKSKKVDSLAARSPDICQIQKTQNGVDMACERVK